MNFDSQYLRVIGSLSMYNNTGSRNRPETAVLHGDVEGKEICTGYGAGSLRTVFLTKEQKESCSITGHAELIIIPSDVYYETLTKPEETRQEKWAMIG